MFSKNNLVRLGEFAYSRTLLGFVGAALANIVLVASIEHITRAATTL
jgi:hypothetical protein